MDNKIGSGVLPTLASGMCCATKNQPISPSEINRNSTNDISEPRICSHTSNTSRRNTIYTKTAAELLLVLASSSSFAAACLPELIIKNRPGFASESDNRIINAEEFHSDAPSDDADAETSDLTEYSTS